LMIELSPVPISQVYAGLFPAFLNPALWQRSGNIPAMVPLISSYIQKAPGIVVPQLVPVLGVFQKLNSSSLHDHDAFYILEAIVQYMKLNEFQGHLPTIFQLIFMRIQEKKTTKYVKSFLVFFAFFVSFHDASVVVQTIDAIQSGLLAMVLESLWIPDIGKVNGNVERKIASIAMTKLLTEAPAVINNYPESWKKLFNSQLVILELPEDETETAGGADDDAIEENAGFTGAYSPLAYAAKQGSDPFPGVQPKVLFARGLSNLARSHGQKLQQLVREIGLSPQAQSILSSYFNLAGVPPAW